MAPTSAEFVADAKRSVRRLEMRDSYMLSDPWWKAWQAGRFEEYPEPPAWPALIREVTGRGVSVRRARIVSEPVSEYIRFEYATTAGIVTAGERVRWVPRRLAAGLALPGTDCWIVDGDRVLFTFYSGDGEVVGRELGGVEAVTLCLDAFEAAWAVGVDHQDYRV
ncbi:DUF6879 family protein [Actinomadura luteofluorescens]|uniref:DUF6879 family protein n=1 Tax=Actinomadura luteofluorescens TaxID=46163 RepID=UPI003D8ADFAC